MSASRLPPLGFYGNLIDRQKGETQVLNRTSWYANRMKNFFPLYFTTRYVNNVKIIYFWSVLQMTNHKTSESRSVVMNSLKSLFSERRRACKALFNWQSVGKNDKSKVWRANEVPKTFGVYREHTTKNGNLVVQFETGTNVYSLFFFSSSISSFNTFTFYVRYSQLTFFFRAF